MEAWANIVKSYSPQSIEFIGTLVVQLLTFWLPSLYYVSLDALFPSFSQRHKIQPAPKQPTGKDIRHCVAVVAKNQLLSTTLHFLLITAKTNAGLPPSYRIETTLPTLFELTRDFIISLLLREALFYYSHRFTAPIALAAQYARPVEQMFANILPIVLPPQILKSHILTFWAFLGYELFGTATVHSGYDFLRGQARMHDLHHEKFNLNYGSMGVLDWVHGTDRLRKRE